MRETLSQMTKRTLAAVLLVLVAGLGLWRCGQALLTAPPNSTLRIEANPSFIVANGGVSVISVAVLEPIGTPVADGTVVQFFTTLGRIDEQGKTNDGIARVNLVSTGLSGTASVTAVSGGKATPPSTPGSTIPGSTNPGPTTTNTAPTTLPTPAATTQFGFASGSGSATVTVAIGSALPANVVASADAPRLTAQRPVTITAFVIDKDGNGVANVPVFFAIASPTATERLDSGGNPLFTDLNGTVSDTIRTTATPGATNRTVSVTVTAANGKSTTIVVPVP